MDRLERFLTTISCLLSFHRIPESAMEGMNCFYFVLFLTVPIIRQLPPPLGYNPEEYGPWPQQGAWVIKMRLPPNWKSSRDPSNFHTITILLAHVRDPDINPMMMGPGLEQIMDWHCSCKAGLRTAASCTHRNAALILLCATSCYNTAKVQEPVFVDTARFVFFQLTI